MPRTRPSSSNVPHALLDEPGYDFHPGCHNGPRTSQQRPYGSPSMAERAVFSPTSPGWLVETSPRGSTGSRALPVPHTPVIPSHLPPHVRVTPLQSAGVFTPAGPRRGAASGGLHPRQPAESPGWQRSLRTPLISWRP